MGPFWTSLRLGHVTEVTDGLSDQRAVQDDELQLAYGGEGGGGGGCSVSGNRVILWSTGWLI